MSTLEPILVQDESTDGNDADDEDYTNYTDEIVQTVAYTPTVTPDVPKFVACVALAIIVAFLILAIEIIPPQSFPRQTDSATLARTGLMYNMQNTSADKCSDFYDYACQQYDSRYTSSSLFSETSNQIESVIAAIVVDRNVTGSYSAAGFYGCFSVEINVDYKNNDRMALYLAPYNLTDNFTIHPAHDTAYPADIQVVVNKAKEESASIYWLQNNLTLDEWVNCNATGLNELMFASLASRSNMWLTKNYYNVNTVYPMPNQNTADVHRLVEMVRARCLSYVQEAPWISEPSRVYLKARLTSLSVFIGGPTRCTTDLSLYSCLEQLHSTAVDSLASIADPSLMWPLNAFDVNAVFSPMPDAIYIPWGITQVPFYNPDWSDLFKMASLGWVIAHEIGHYVDVSAFHNDSVSVAQDIAAVQTCLTNDYSDMGSVRSKTTVHENWADFWGINAVALPSLDFYIIWTQTWCDSGAARVLTDSTDEHSSPYLRSNATLTAFPPFYWISECPLKTHDLCGTA